MVVSRKEVICNKIRCSASSKLSSETIKLFFFRLLVFDKIPNVFDPFVNVVIQLSFVLEEVFERLSFAFTVNACFSMLL